jgi:hypothetical protein
MGTWKVDGALVMPNGISRNHNVLVECKTLSFLYYLDACKFDDISNIIQALKKFMRHEVPLRYHLS